jgi:hypothetical protein
VLEANPQVIGKCFARRLERVVHWIAIPHMVGC